MTRRSAYRLGTTEAGPNEPREPHRNCNDPAKGEVGEGVNPEMSEPMTSHRSGLNRRPLGGERLHFCPSCGSAGGSHWTWCPATHDAPAENPAPNCNETAQSGGDAGAVIFAAIDNIAWLLCAYDTAPDQMPGCIAALRATHAGLIRVRASTAPGADFDATGRHARGGR